MQYAVVTARPAAICSVHMTRRVAMALSDAQEERH